MTAKHIRIFLPSKGFFFCEVLKQSWLIKPNQNYHLQAGAGISGVRPFSYIACI